MVPRRGLEPPHPYGYQHLKLARLPIPPSGLSVMHLLQERAAVIPGQALQVNAANVENGVFPPPSLMRRIDKASKLWFTPSNVDFVTVCGQTKGETSCLANW